MNDFLVSILIPFYNSEKHMHISLETVKKQTYKNIEIICLDDGSTDNTYLKLLEYKKIIPNLKVYKNSKNKKISYCRNKLISLAKGKYFFFLDSDDEIESDAIEVLVNNSNNGSYDIVSGQSLVVLNWKKFKFKFPFLAVSRLFNKTNQYTYVKKNICLCWMNLFKKDFWDSLNVKFLENYDFEDFGLIPYVFLNCDSFYFVPKKLYHYIRRKNSISDFNSKHCVKKIEHMLTQIEYLIDLLRQKNQLVQYKVQRSLNGILLIAVYAILMMRNMLVINKSPELKEIDKKIYQSFEKTKIELKYSKTWWKSITYFANSLILWFCFKKIRFNKINDLKGLKFWKYRNF